MPSHGVSPRPHAVFLSALTGSVSSYDTSVRRFFGKGTRAAPTELHRRTLSNTSLPHGGPDAMFALQSTVVLPPGASRTLLYAYGYGDPASIAPLVKRLRSGAGGGLTRSEAGWRNTLPELHLPRDGWLAARRPGITTTSRSSQTYEDAWHTSFIDQGIPTSTNGDSISRTAIRSPPSCR